ncbi:hypothetical protein [Nocardia sp. NPDC050718]|uniref:hypothetical protein n=1 Tax=Nocardia sp. NPDC050718 TaxID=3155788 RepID=UPI0033C868E8
MTGDRRARAAVAGYCALLALIIVGPLAGSGYLLLRDAVSTPRSYLTDSALGLGAAAPRAVPQDALLAVLSPVVDGGLLVKAILIVALWAAGYGAAALTREFLTASTPAQLVAATIALWNPYVAERLLQGHWSLLTGYAALPWIALAAARVRQATQPRSQVFSGTSATNGIQADGATSSNRSATRRTTADGTTADGAAPSDRRRTSHGTTADGAAPSGSSAAHGTTADRAAPSGSSAAHGTTADRTAPSDSSATHRTTADRTTSPDRNAAHRTTADGNTSSTRSAVIGAWAALTAGFAAAGLTPTGSLLAAIIGLALVGRRAFLPATVLWILTCAPWLTATALGSGAEPSDPAGVSAFAARAEPWLGTLGSLAGLGGIWNSEAVPVTRTTPLALVGTVLLLGIVALGVRTVWALGRDGRALLVIAAVAIVLPALGATGPGLAVGEWLVVHVPGAGLLRDTQKYVALAMPAYALCAAAACGTALRWARRTASAQPGPTTSQDFQHAGPADSSLAGPTNSVEADPTESTHAEPTGSIDAGPADASRPAPSHSIDADPADASAAAPTHSIDADPADASRAALTHSIHADPADASRAAPTGPVNAASAASDNADPWNTDNAAPTAATARTERGTSTVAALFIALLILPLADLAWGVGGEMRPAHYPAGWAQVVERMDAPGDVAVLPTGMFRRFPYSGTAPVLDPAPRILPNDVLQTGELRVRGYAVNGEGNRARRVEDALLRGAAPAEIAALGVGWIVVERTTPGPLGDSGKTLAAAELAYQDADLALYRLADHAPTDIATPAQRWISAAAHLLWATLLIGGLLTAALLSRLSPARAGRPNR